MRRMKQYKGFVIAFEWKNNTYYVFTKDEDYYGEGCRYPEHEAGSVQEAIDFIDSY